MECDVAALYEFKPLTNTSGRFLSLPGAFIRLSLADAQQIQGTGLPCEPM